MGAPRCLVDEEEPAKEKKETKEDKRKTRKVCLL